MHTPVRKVCGAFLGLLFLLSLLTVPVFCQEGLSTLRGTATDTSGAVVPGVTVTAREVLTNVVAANRDDGCTGKLRDAGPEVRHLPGDGHPDRLQEGCGGRRPAAEQPGAARRCHAGGGRGHNGSDGGCVRRRDPDGRGENRIGFQSRGTVRDSADPRQRLLRHVCGSGYSCRTSRGNLAIGDPRDSQARAAPRSTWARMV